MNYYCKLCILKFVLSWLYNHWNSLLIFVSKFWITIAFFWPEKINLFAMWTCLNDFFIKRIRANSTFSFFVGILVLPMLGRLTLDPIAFTSSKHWMVAMFCRNRNCPRSISSLLHVLSYLVAFLTSVIDNLVRRSQFNTCIEFFIESSSVASLITIISIGYSDSPTTTLTKNGINVIVVCL